MITEKPAQLSDYDNHRGKKIKVTNTDGWKGRRYQSFSPASCALVISVIVRKSIFPEPILGRSSMM